MFERVYLNDSAKTEEPKAQNIVKRLFGHYMEHPDELPAEFTPALPAGRLACPPRVRLRRRLHRSLRDQEVQGAVRRSARAPAAPRMGRLTWLRKTSTPGSRNQPPMPVDGSIIAEIQRKVDLLHTSASTSPSKKGREYIGLCPFHAERTPSFSLNADKQVWHCYGCDAGGDLIKFVQRYENVDFPDGVADVGARAGVELRESPDAHGAAANAKRSTKRTPSRNRIFAAALQQESRTRSPTSRAAASTRATVEKFGIGYAPDALGRLRRALLRKSRRRLAAGGSRPASCRAASASDGYYDFFRNRLMLPVYNLTGEVMAFGGRALGDEQPKYLNTPSTAAYTKGQHVYALNVARARRRPKARSSSSKATSIAIALHQAGFGNAVASLGTAFTPEQARELRRVAPNSTSASTATPPVRPRPRAASTCWWTRDCTVRVVAPARREGSRRNRARRRRGRVCGAPRCIVPWKDFKIELACSRISGRSSPTKATSRAK